MILDKVIVPFLSYFFFFVISSHEGRGGRLLICDSRAGIIKMFIPSKSKE